MNGVEPYATVKATLEAIAGRHPASRIDDLLPWAFVDRAAAAEARHDAALASQRFAA